MWLLEVTQNIFSCRSEPGDVITSVLDTVSPRVLAGSASVYVVFISSGFFSARRTCKQEPAAHHKRVLYCQFCDVLSRTTQESFVDVRHTGNSVRHFTQRGLSEWIETVRRQ
jgi:hypothetical protein